MEMTDKEIMNEAARRDELCRQENAALADGRVVTQEAIGATEGETELEL
jgi:hypothetical protein